MRKHFVHFLFTTLLITFCAASTYAQSVVKGKVVDAETNEELIGASVMVEGTSTGVVTGMDGSFTLNVKSANPTLLFKYIGYKDLKMKLTQKGKVDLGTITMQSNTVALADITITSSVAIQRKTPVAVSTLDPVFIEEKLGTQEFPEILKSTPGVYATKQSGGYGDSRINLRGFESANIAVMVNGVPMNDMEWGGVYWSNWAGLSDVTRSMQVQRGLGASKICSPSVGGSINIITRTTDAKKGGSVLYGIGNDGYNKIGFNMSTGMNEKGWAFSILGSKTWGDGYIQGTAFTAYSWFVNISKKINDNQSLSLTALGAPQFHNKRYDQLTILEWAKQAQFGRRYNATYGFDANGQERVGSNYNYYHKPQISLNHNWQINYKSSLSTSLYMSIGQGGGYSAQGNNRSSFYGATNGIPNTTYRKIDGTFDYATLMQDNATADNGSLAAMSSSINNHLWYGAISTYTCELAQSLSLQAGLDLRYYKGTHTNKLVDLYGGSFFIDPARSSSTNWRKDDLGYVNEKLKVGDVVYRDYDGFVTQEGAFAQLEYSKDKLSAFASGNINNNSYWRKDRFYYDNKKSEVVNKLGFGGKGGANYNLDDHNNVFANVGFFSRTPFYSGGIFLSSALSNALNPNSTNEKVFSYEVGYGYKSKVLSANVNVYRTAWKDKTMTKAVVSGDAASNYINMNGVNALHQGAELDFKYKPFNELQITGMLSLGDWNWDSNATGFWYNRNGEALNKKSEVVPAGSPDHAQSTLNLKGIHVGNSAQTTAALGVNYEFMKGLRFGLDGNYYGRNFSNFDISVADIKSSGVQPFSQPWRIPDAFVFDFNMNYRFKIGNLDASLNANVKNILNEKYITDAQDNGAKTGGHGWSDATVFYGFGRTWSSSIKINF
ncbi:TonB-dependent receptor [Bacteroides sedimenti]|uniref:TonB-dependent receptor n=1 Tax=Bacteroides sedimenti TaxID=2136147 RepID=A0ABM8IEG8_9BACE